MPSSARITDAPARPDFAWLKAGRDWFRYVIGAEPVIVAIYYEQADIPRRLDLP